VFSEGVKRDLATAAELGLSQTVATEISEKGIPAWIDCAASRHGVISPTGSLTSPVQSSREVAPLCERTSPAGHFAATIGQPVDTVMVATMNVGQYARYCDARLWTSIA
jgi:hypothetical protein